MYRRIQTDRDCRHRGVVAVYVALALLPILGILAVVIDIGILRDRRNHVQASADAAAMTAAVELFHNLSAVDRGTADPGGAARAAALENLKANGYSDENSTIIINIPPKQSASGFNGKLGYAEVIVNFEQQRYFSAIFGNEDLLVGGRAIARGGTQDTGKGLIALDRHKDSALDISGNGGVEVRGGSIFVNSDSKEALTMSGNSWAKATSHEITGDRRGSGNSGLIGPVHTGVPPIPDPLRHMPEPDSGDYPVRANSQIHVNGNDTAVLEPGVYEGGIKISGNGYATLEPGIYVMKGGGFEFSGNGGLSAEGVLIYVMSGDDSGGIKITGNGSVDLTPLPTGPWRGISLFQQRSQTDRVHLSGNGDMRITGTIYAPGAELKATGNGSSDVFAGTIIVNSADISGNGQVTVETDGAAPVARDLVRLVE